jgi:hypothetical protein
VVRQAPDGRQVPAGGKIAVPNHPLDRRSDLDSGVTRDMILCWIIIHFVLLQNRPRSSMLSSWELVAGRAFAGIDSEGRSEALEVVMKAIPVSITAIVLCLADWCAAQSFNIDIGPVGNPAPPSTYAAAGWPGDWFVTPASTNVTVNNLVDVAGNATSVSVRQIGGTETLSLSDAAVAGDDATLLNDCLITHTAIENCLFFSGLQGGTYEVIVYARMPDEPDVVCNADVDQEPGNPKKPVGGVWIGSHENGVSYSIHVATVAGSGPQAGNLGVHSGVPPGGDFGIGAALNGLQIHRISDCPADCANDDGVVNVFDLLEVLLNWGTSGPGADIAEFTNTVDVFDLIDLLSQWGSC